MQVILLQKVENLGQLGDRVAVRPGYGRNFLIPRGKAVTATPANVKKFEGLRAELEREATASLSVAQARAEKLGGFSVTIAANAGDEGKLFGSVGTADIAAAAHAAGATLDKHELRLPDGPLRHIGEHEVRVHLHADVTIAIRVVIVPEA